MAPLETIVTIAALAIFTAVPLLIMMAEGRKAIAFMLMFIGFGATLTHRVLAVLWADGEEPTAIRAMQLVGMALAASAFLGYFWPRIRPKLGEFGGRFGISFRGRTDRDAVPAPSSKDPATADDAPQDGSDPST